MYIGRAGKGNAVNQHCQALAINMLWHDIPHFSSLSLRGELIVYQSSWCPSVSASVGASVCSHFQTRISLRPMGGSQPNFI